MSAACFCATAVTLVMHICSHTSGICVPCPHQQCLDCTNEDHLYARLGKYKDQLITVGDRTDNQKTEILDRAHNGEYKWTLGPNYNFSPTGKIYHYSMVNVPQMGLNEEYLLLIGGQKKGYPNYEYSDKVHKYNGKWSFFGNLQKVQHSWK